MQPDGARPETDCRRICLVDGDPNVRRARQLMLRSADYTVCAYATCAALLKDPNVLTCDCIIADVEMMDIGGVELLQAMRHAGWQGAAILLTDEISADLAAVVRNAEFVAILPKAPAEHVLLKAVGKTIGRYRSRGKLAATALNGQGL